MAVPFSTTFCCSRCGPKVVLHCCDICDPHYFIFPTHELSGKRPSALRKTMPKPYERGPAEKSLYNALIIARREMAKETFPDGSFLTPQAFMSTILLDRIVNLAHYQLIKTTTHLHEQIVWGYLDTYATRVLGLIQLHCPPVMASPFTTAPLQHSLTNATASSSNTTAIVNPPKKRKCGLCGVEGHYSKFTIYPLIVVVNLLMVLFQKKSVRQPIMMHLKTLPRAPIRRILSLYKVCMHMRQLLRIQVN